MNTTFFHDCILVKDKSGKVYTTGGLDSKKLLEYSDFFGELTVFSRGRRLKEDEDIKKMSLASASNINFFSIPKLNLFSLFFGKDRKKIKQLVRKSDFIIARLPSYIGIVAVNEAKKEKKNYLVEMVACPWDALWNYGKITKKICALPTFLLNKYIVKKAKNVLYVSNEFLQNRYPTNGKSIGCSDVIIAPTDIEILEKRLEKIKSKKDYTNIKIGTLANIDLKCKGQHFVIKAISKLNKEGIQADYYLVGGGNSTFIRNVAKKYGVENNVHIVGSLPHDKVFDFLDDIDLYIQPSLQEGLPRAVIEAMSRACPVIGSKTGGIPELIEKKYIFKKKNVKEISKLIKTVVHNTELLIEAAQYNFEKSKEFEKDVLNLKRKNFYNYILKGANKQCVK